MDCFHVRNVDPHATWGFPKIRGAILGVPIIRTIVFWGLYWDPPILGNSHIARWVRRKRFSFVDGS